MNIDLRHKYERVFQNRITIVLRTFLLFMYWKWSVVFLQPCKSMNFYEQDFWYPKEKIILFLKRFESEDVFSAIRY